MKFIPFEKLNSGQKGLLYNLASQFDEEIWVHENVDDEHIKPFYEKLCAWIPRLMESEE